jgi:hypothetical protein
MSKERIDMLASDLWKEVFVVLDTEPGVTGEEAGRIATSVEQVFRQEAIVMRSDGARVIARAIVCEDGTVYASDELIQETN